MICMNENQTKTLIVGAGLTGLLLAQKLQPHREVVIYDKARGVGGRMATRRTEHAKFDHGAQFYSLKDPIRELHSRWLERGLVRKWFTNGEGVERFVAKDGMTALAKDLASDLEVVLNERVSTISKDGDQWRAVFESGLEVISNTVVMTCPVPQSIEILDRSGLTSPAKLADVTYTKAVVILIENSPTPFPFSQAGYLEPATSTLFSIADQFEKGISKTGALTVTLSPELSDTIYDDTDANILDRAVAELIKIAPTFKAGDAQVKKWRYCQVQNSFGDMFLKLQDGLYLAGDGFGGASLNGAARSATAMTEQLLNA
jgi:renalase